MPAIDPICPAPATLVSGGRRFEPRLVRVVIEDTPATAGVLDPEGAALADGPDLYFELLHNLAAALHGCLGRSD